MNPNFDSLYNFHSRQVQGDIKKRTVQGSLITISAQAIRFTLNICSTAIIARFVLPEDFGLIAMVIVVTSFVELFKDGGLFIATIQKAEVEHSQISTLFWLNLFSSFVLMFITFFSAPLISWFYKEPRLVGITYALASTFIFSGLTVQHKALLTRQMRFFVIYSIEILSTIFGIVCGILLAMRGFGYWSLVIMQIAMVVINAMFIWFFCDWRPSMPHRGSGIRSMLAFGGNLTGANLLNYISRNFDNLLVGSMLGSSSLGLYSIAYKLLMLPIQQITAPLSQVVQPTLCRLQKDPKRYRHFYLEGISYCVTIGIPIVVFAIVVAEEVIGIFLGNQWSSAVPIFRALAPAALLGTFNVATAWVFIPLGRTDKQLKSCFFSTIYTVISFIIGIRWGMIGIAIAYSVSEFIKRPFEILYAFHNSPLKLLDIGHIVWRPLLSSALAGAILIIIKLWIVELNLFIKFPIELTGFIVFYSIFFSFLPGGKDLLYRMKDTMISLYK